MTVWDVDAALARPLPARARTKAAPNPLLRVQHSDAVDQEEIEKYARKLARKDAPWDKRAGQLLLVGLKGHAVAGAGARDDTLYKMAGALAKGFPYCSPEDLAEYFRFSIEVMRADGSDRTVEKFADQIRRHQEKVHADLDEKYGSGALETREEQGADTRAQLILRAFGGRRAAAYSDAEIEEWDTDQDNPLANRWIVQCGKCAFLFFDGGYLGPFGLGRSELATAVAQYLSPAPVRFEISDEKGEPRIKDVEQLLRSHGTVAREWKIDLTAERSYLRDGVFYESTCHVEPLEPAYDAQVHEWLTLMAGDEQARAKGKVDQLLAWLTGLTHLGTAAPALVLIGTSNVGKSALAACCARVYSSAGTPTSLEHVMGDFNAGLVRCPVVFGDESVPKDVRGNVRFDPLKELITSTSRYVNEKFVPHREAIGACRIILAANNFESLKTSGSLTDDDRRALSERFLFLRPDPRAAAWWDDFHARGGCSPAVWRERAAKHLLWLRDNCSDLLRPGRLLVPGDCAELDLQLRSGQGAAWPLLAWIYDFVMDPATHVRKAGGRPLAAEIRGGRVWIDTRILLERWADYMGDERPPSRQRLTVDGRACFDAERYRPRSPDGQRLDYRLVKADVLEHWTTSRGESAEDLRDALRTDVTSVVQGVARPN